MNIINAIFPKTNKAIHGLKADDFETSKDVGGHGGAIRSKKPIDGKYLFLKPKTADGTESTNYKIINMDKDLAKWMPKVYGEMEINGRSYLVMENMRKSVDGSEMQQLVDIKLAGKVDGLNKAIANSKEMKITRGGKKSAVTKLWMRFVTSIAPHYLITNGGIRLFDYFQSKTLLKESLAGISSEHLEKLLEDLIQMQRDIAQSGIAFIGASIALIRQKDGSVKPVLIDPAHIQCSNDLNQQVVQAVGAEGAKKVFFECLTSEGKNQYQLYKTSNEVALLSIIETVRALRK